MNKKHYIIPIFVPHKGCPHDCVFCNQKKITGQITEITDTDVQDKIEKYLETMPQKDAIIEVAFYGGSFTAIPIEDQSKLLKAVDKYIKLGKIQNIRISTRPDCIDKLILDNLKQYGVTIVELGVQSMDEEVLAKSRRGHSKYDVIQAVKLLKDYGFTVGVQIMIGLPLDTKEKSLDSARQLAALKPHMARIYPALVISNTFMEDMYLKKQYEPLTLKEAVEISKEILILFEKNGIEVIRIGLQPTENIIMGKDVVAGPFHPSMRQLVDSLVYRNMIAYQLRNANMKYLDCNLIIKVNPKDISDLLGQKKENIKYIKDSFGFNEITVIQDESLDRDKIMLQNVEINRKMSKKDYYNILN